MKNLVDTNDLGAGQLPGQEGKGEGPDTIDKEKKEEEKGDDKTPTDKADEKIQDGSKDGLLSDQNQSNCFAHIQFSKGQTLRIKSKNGLFLAVKQNQ